MKRKKTTISQKTYYDLACGSCGQTNIFHALFMSTTAFCPQCQVNTYHKVRNIQVVMLDEFLQPIPVPIEKLYSPAEGSKKMGFVKAKREF